MLGVGYDTIEALLGRDGGIPLLTLAVLLVVKVLATAVSNATGFVGGGFAPSLFLGAVLGNCYGQMLGEGGLDLPVAEPPAYAMVGMAAVLAGSARAPLTALLLLFELTRDIRIVLPLMAAAGLSAAPGGTLAGPARSRPAGTGSDGGGAAWPAHGVIGGGGL